MLLHVVRFSGLSFQLLSRPNTSVGAWMHVCVCGIYKKKREGELRMVLVSAWIQTANNKHKIRYICDVRLHSRTMYTPELLMVKKTTTNKQTEKTGWRTRTGYSSHFHNKEKQVTIMTVLYLMLNRSGLRWDWNLVRRMLVTCNNLDHRTQWKGRECDAVAW